MEEDGVGLRRYLEVVLNWWWLILLGPIAAGFIGYAISAQQTPVYQAEATVLVQQTQNSAFPTLGDIQTSRQLAATYEKLITTRPVLQEVVEELALPHSVESLKGMVGASVVRDTQLVRVWARSEDPEQTALVANTLAETFIDRTRETRLAEIARLQSAARARGLTDSQNLLEAQISALGSLTLVEPAIVPDSPVEPRKLLNTLVAALLGGLVALGAAFVLEHLNDTVRSTERVERLLGQISLGMVFRWRSQEFSNPGIVVEEHPRSVYAEAFRQVRANLQFALAAHPSKTIVVTSAGPGEGKSTVVANVGAAAARSGSRIILVDADMRRPALHKFFGVSNESGLSSYLITPQATLDQMVQPTEIEGLFVLPAGPIPPNPAELLQSPRMQTLVEELNAHADLALFDTPPALAVADTVLVASLAGSAILVAEANHTRMDTFRGAVAALNRAGVRILGVVLNKFKVRRLGYGYNYRYHHYYYRRPGEEREHQNSADGRDALKGRRRHGLVGRIQRLLGAGRQ